MVKHAGSFAKGFMDSFLAAYKLQMTAELYKARENYYNNKGLGGAKAQSDRELQNVIAGGRNDPSYGSGGSGGGTGGSASVASLDPNATSIVAKVLTDRGVQPQVAAGAVAGMMGESGPKLDPTAFNSKDPHGGAGGIAQWNGNRLIGNNGMLAYAKSQGIDVNPNVPTDSKKVPLQIQADYLGKELDGPYNHVLKGLQVTNSGEEGLHNWVNNFEVPADKAGAIAQRRQYIQPVTATLSNPRATATAAATPTKGPNKGKTQVAAADLPAKDATAEESGETQGGGKFVVPGSSEKVDLPAAASPASALGAPLAAPGAQQPNDIASLPRYGTGPADTQDPSGRMIPPAGGMPSMGYPALAPGPANVAPSPAPQATINPDTDKSAINAPLPPERPKDLEANKPSAAAQPVSSSNPPGKSAIPSSPSQDPRFTQITAPNSDPNARNRPQSTALDLSHLWGPNPPVAQRAPQPPAASPPPPSRPQDDSWNDVPPTPDFTGMTDEMIMGSAKGGPIRRYAQGGAIPSTAFADAGPVSALYPSYSPAAPAPTPGLQGNTLAATQYMNSLPGMTQVDTGNAARGYYTAYGPGSFNGAGGTQILANYAKLTPDQKTQYDAMQAGTWQPPAAAPAAAPSAPAAPAPPPAQPTVVPVANSANPQAVDPVAIAAADPTMSTVTGAVKLPNSIQAKSYDPNVDAQTGAGFANTNNTGGTDYSVGSDDKLKTDTTGTTIYGSDDDNKKNQNTILSAKGGAIPSRPTTKFAGGGSAVMAAMNSPNYVGPTLQGGWSGADRSTLAPNQQAWADTQTGLLAQQAALGKADYAYWSAGGKNPEGVNGNSMQYWNQLTTMPDAVWPTAAPAAPTPMNVPGISSQSVPNSSNPQYVDPTAFAAADPTTTTVTGGVKLPNSIQAKSYDPNVDAQTGAGFADTNNVGGTDYSVGSDDLLKQNSSGQISGKGNQNNTTILSKRGGPIPKVTQRVNRYDDGGGVSPSAAGAPPGLGGQGAIPPIYYNPATYAGAGAPVGKGISQNSAPTFNAGAIPSLPMVKGGAVAFADGGGVGDDDLNTMASLDAADARDDAGSAAPATPMTNADPGFYINPDAPSPDATPESAQAPAPTSTDHIPPPDPTTPQVKDDAGNPSKGLIGAISDGLHWLGGHLGLGGGGQAPAIARDPTQQDQRQQFVKNDPSGPTYLTHAQAEELNDAADPNHQLQGAYRNIAGLEAGYKWALSRGDDATAGRLAASILHYSVLTSQNLSKQAADALYKGDMQGAVDKMNEASDAVPDGRLVHASLNPDGTVTVQGKNLNGEVEWQKHGAAATILEHATSLGKSGKLQWDSLESQAAKYDSTYANAVKNRQGNASSAARETHEQEVWQHQQDLLDAKQAAKDKAAKDASDTEGGVLTSMFNPPGNSEAPANATVPPTAPALPGPGSRPTEASATQPAAAAPEGTPPVVANAPTSQAAPPPPTADVGSAGPTPPPSGVNPNAPAAGAQTVAADTGPTVLPNPARDPRFAQLSPAAQGRALQIYQGSVNERRAWESAQYKQQHDDSQANATQGRLDQREHFTQDQANERAKTAQEAAVQAETRKAQAPRPDQDVARTFALAPDETGVATGKAPANYLYDAYGSDPKDPANTAGQAAFTKDFATRPEQNIVANALVSGYTHTHGATPQNVADVVAGIGSGRYNDFHAKVMDDPAYGRRYAITVNRPQGGRATIVLPEDDLANLTDLAKANLAKAKAAPTAPAITAPTPHAQSFPGTTPGGAPSGPAFGGKPAAPTANQQWWLNAAMGRGQPAIPSFPTPTPGQNTRGLVQ